MPSTVATGQPAEICRDAEGHAGGGNSGRHGEGEDFLTLFGRPKRQSACECERTSNVTLSHALNLINGDMVGDAVSDKTTGSRGLWRKRMTTEGGRRNLSERLEPSAQRRGSQRIRFGHRAKSALEVAQDLAWALLNSPAFLFNR